MKELITIRGPVSVLGFRPQYYSRPGFRPDPVTRERVEIVVANVLDRRFHGADTILPK
jgi:hypothetical protein